MKDNNPDIKFYALDKTKIRENVPCMVREGFKKFVPKVDCELRCGTCGWNPAVRKERLAKKGVVNA